MATHQVYQQGLLGLADGNADWLATNVTAILLADAYTPNLTSHSTYGDVSANEITDTDYSPQGIATRTITNNAGVIEYDSADISFGDPVTISARYMVFVVGDPVALAAGNRLISLHTFDTIVSSTNAIFQVTAPTGGWFNLSAV